MVSGVRGDRAAGVGGDRGLDRGSITGERGDNGALEGGLVVGDGGTGVIGDGGVGVGGDRGLNEGSIIGLIGDIT